eukprot:8207866-Alexandrium_andersonii.AAC.1
MRMRRATPSRRYPGRRRPRATRSPINCRDSQQEMQAGPVAPNCTSPTRRAEQTGRPPTVQACSW